MAVYNKLFFKRLNRGLLAAMLLIPAVPVRRPLAAGWEAEVAQGG